MVGFKKVPTKAVLLTFLISIFLIILLYVDFSTDESLPLEIIETTENFEDTASDVLSYQIHEVKNGENLSIIFDKIFKSKILKKNGILVLHRNFKSNDILRKIFNILEQKKYGLSKIIFCNFN